MTRNSWRGAHACTIARHAYARRATSAWREGRRIHDAYPAAESLFDASLSNAYTNNILSNRFSSQLYWAKERVQRRLCTRVLRGAASRRCIFKTSALKRSTVGGYSRDMFCRVDNVIRGYRLLQSTTPLQNGWLWRCSIHAAHRNSLCGDTRRAAPVRTPLPASLRLLLPPFCVTA